jgi:adenine-specific DNA methylase
MIETAFDIPFVAQLALREKQVQQSYRPVIAVHKWFARRPGTLFRALLLSEFAAEKPLQEAFYESNSLSGIRIADPFMGGGTPLLEGNRVGCDVVGFDINPMAYWIVRQEIEHLNLRAYRMAADRLRLQLETKIGHLYRTTCTKCGRSDAHAKYFLWVKTQVCKKCTERFDLFPGFLVSEDARHPANVLVCGACGRLNERKDLKRLGKCSGCAEPLGLKGPAGRSQCNCPKCGAANRYPDTAAGPPRHRLFAIEYHCHDCKPNHSGRFFKTPDSDDMRRLVEAQESVKALRAKYVPDDEIPKGDETDRLHRWGYRFYREMFNARQLLGLELGCGIIAGEPGERVRHALSTNLSDLLRYQNMLCRYDTMALKSLDIFSVHGFPVSLIQCESNMIGIRAEAGSSSIGSGGWSNVIDKFEKAKAFCDEPFEVRHENGRKTKVAVPGEWIGDRRSDLVDESRTVELNCADASQANLKPNSLDAVFTDPPYYGSVQYAELMDFCYVWLRRLAPRSDKAFKALTTRHISELTENDNMKRGLETFADGLSAVLSRMADALKVGAPLAFTYHHNRLEAYIPIAVAILDAGLVCTAAIPCPAEMEASIHINGTGSSIIDTVFVCRSKLTGESQSLADSTEAIAAAVSADIRQLREAGVEASAGDIRCITFGHLTRVAIGKLRAHWRSRKPIAGKVVAVNHCLAGLEPDRVGAYLNHGRAPVKG